MPQFDSSPRDTTGTKGHKRLHRFLVSVMGFIVEDEYPAGPYSIDCYVPEVHAGFEYDGKDFHGSTKQKARDQERDSWIMGELGIPIMRFSDSDLLEGARADMFVAVSAWLEVYDNIAERRQMERRHQ